MTAVVFTDRGDGWYSVVFDYDPDLVDLIKTTVPARGGRSWHPRTREWRVHAAYVGSLARAIRALGHTVIGLDRQQSPKQKPADDPASWARALFTHVGPARAMAVYHALTKVLHPDNAKTGDTQLQQQLNRAFSELRQETAS